MLIEMNDRKVEAPEGFKLGSDGMWDTLEYRGFSISSFEEGKMEGELYVGPWMALDEFGATEIEGETLPEVQASIDAFMAEA